MLNQLKLTLEELFRILRRQYQPMQFYLGAGFSSLAQAFFSLILPSFSLKLQLIVGNLNFIFSANELGTRLHVLFVKALEIKCNRIKNANQIKNANLSKKFLVSYDETSLFTNIPL